MSEPNELPKSRMESSFSGTNRFQKLFKEKNWIIPLVIILLFSIILEMYVLTIYPISYGIDGPYYDIQVRYILRTGFPLSNDPPLVYYYLVPFVLLIGNSSLGIKIGMSLISSLMVLPAFLLTETFTKRIGVESKVPALLSAFMMTVNLFYFRMIEEFMQNLVGVFFLLWFLYFGVKWFENFKEWKKYGFLAIVFLICTILTHVYVAAIAIILFSILFLFNLIVKWVKTRTLPKYELKILGIFGALITVLLVPLLLLYPEIVENFIGRIDEFLNQLFSISGSSTAFEYTPILMFLTIPYIVGLIAVSIYFYQGIKSRNNGVNTPVISKRTFLSLLYLGLTILLMFLVVIPTSWQDRFILLSFLPIALIVPIGLKFVEILLSNRYPTKKRVRQVVIKSVAILFAFSSFFAAFQMFNTMGPTISMEQYYELEQIRTDYIPLQVNNTGIIYLDDFAFGYYWVIYILEMEIAVGNITNIVKAHEGRYIYGLFRIKFVEPPSKPFFEYPWCPFLPYGVFLSAPPEASPPLYRKSPPFGLLIFNGTFFQLRLIYNANGTFYG